MAKPTQKDLVRALLDRHGRTFAEELRIDVSRGSPSPLFRLLCASILMSARISSDIAVKAAKALAKQGWTSADKMGSSGWDERVRALNRAGYARYQERTATMLGDSSQYLQERWKGDLRRLREEADRDPGKERSLLKNAKGLGDVGVDIFFREAQVAWDELRPFADRRALDAAGKLGLPKDAEKLQRLAGGEFPRLVAGLIRIGLEDDFDGVRDAARSR